MEGEIDVWLFDSKSCVKCGVLTYYHTAHVYFKATVWLVTKLMGGGVYTEKHFTVIDLGMNGPLGLHPDSHFYPVTGHSVQSLWCELKITLNSHYVYSSVMQFDCSIC